MISDDAIVITFPEMDPLDQLYLAIDTLNMEQVNKIIKYCEEHKLIANLSETRRKNLAEQLRIERIKWKKEMNNVKKNKKEESDDENEEEVEIKTIKSKRASKSKK